MKEFHIDQKYKNFRVTKSEKIDELACHLIELEHEPSGASVMHIANNDPENLFCLNLQTRPYNSNGIAHILEHIVLCGSEKFPIKDPFFSMTRRSLNTFMNAMTGSDFTCYPASSQVKKDFYNLLDVYLDAVFYPKIKYYSFLQEGHRLELKNPEDITNSPLTYKGIVFNEMKGAMNSSEQRLWYALMKHLTPDLTYAHNSGGDPSVIPSLTHEELIEFHKKYYHPSRCLFFFYGNFDLSGHLDFIEERVLHKAEKLPPLEPIEEQPKFSSPKEVIEYYPSMPEDRASDKTMAAFSWLTCPLSNQKEALALSLLDIILMDNDASLLKKEIMNSGLCKQAEAYIDTEMSEMPWAIVCKGCSDKNVEKLNTLIFDTLNKICESGIDMHFVDAAIHQLEFARTEITSDRYPFGLTLFFRSGLIKSHGAEPESALKIHSLFEHLIKATRDPKYLTTLIKKYFIDNPHFVKISMLPDPKMSQEEEEIEHQKLEELQKTLSNEEKQKIVKEANALSAFQKELEDNQIDCLPKVTLLDVPTHAQDLSLEKLKLEDMPIYHHGCFTNQVMYVDILFDLPEMNSNEISYLSLFAELLTELGVADRSFEENLQEVHLYTGGLDASVLLFQDVKNPDQCTPSFSLRGKALYRNSEKLFQLMVETLQSANFNDPNRLKDLMREHFSELEHRLHKNAMRYAVQRSLCSYSVASKLSDDWNGLSYYKKIRNLMQDLDGSIEMLIPVFKKLQKQLLELNTAQVVITCDNDHLLEMKKQQFYALKNLSGQTAKPWKAKLDLTPLQAEAHSLSSPVAFNSFGFRTASYTDPDAPALLVATELFENTFLHQSIREIGGAYGSGATYSPSTGNFYFYSFRDPHIANTYSAFQDSVDKIAKAEFSDRELEEAKLGILQGIDSPISPGSRAFTAFSWNKSNKTYEMRDAFRKAVIELSAEQLIAAVKKHLMPKIKNGSYVTLASKELLERENEALIAKKMKSLKIQNI